MAKKNKGLSINIMPDEIVGSEIIKNGEYKYASIGVKFGDNEYMRITYEWKGDVVPDFVMEIMSWMQANKDVINECVEKGSAEYQALKERL